MDDKLQAVFNEDLIKILKETNQLLKIENGEVFCDYCATLITLSNIQIIIPITAMDFKYVCNDPNCVEKHYKQNGKQK
jgi:hypothetical protein